MTKKEESVLKKRLMQGGIAWILGDYCISSIVKVLEHNKTSCLMDFASDFFLVTDERGWEFGDIEDIKNAGSDGVERGGTTLIFARDYGTADDLDIDGGFGYVEPDGGFSEELGRVVELRLKYKTSSGQKVEANVVFARIERMEFAARFLMSERSKKSPRMVFVFLNKNLCRFNGMRIGGSWPTKIAVALGATRLIADKDSVRQSFHFDGNNTPEEDERVAHAMISERHPWFERLPQVDCFRKIKQLDDDFSIYSLKCMEGGCIRSDLRVGALARLAFETYFRNADLVEIERLQSGEYGHETFRLNRTLPVIKRAHDIRNAPFGSHAGERDYLDNHYWRNEYDIGGVTYRIVNDWKEPPNPRDNRTPLEDWIRRMGLAL